MADDLILSWMRRRSGRVSAGAGVMSDDMKNADKRDETKQEPTDVELTEAEISEVTGGFNPQPDPPGKSIA
jgi:hypothetical protein